MIYVLCPYDKVMVETPDRESPWEISETMNEELVEWLNSHAGDSWDWDYAEDGALFSIEDPDVAILFKLTWGGR